MKNNGFHNPESFEVYSNFETPSQYYEEEEIRQLRPRSTKFQRPRPKLNRPPRRPQRPLPRRVLSPQSTNYSYPAFTETEPQPAGTEYIRWVQTMLNQVLSLQLPVDGLMDVQTRSAIRSFQERNGLSVTGIVGPDTERILIASREGQSSGATTTKPDEPTMAVPTQPAAPAGELEFEWKSKTNRKSRGYIKWVQQSLNQIMRLKLAVDGILGTQTRSAIRSFQQKQGLVADGIVGAKTEAALKAASILGAPVKPTLIQYVKDFSGSAAECTTALTQARKTKAEALAIINAQIGLAIAMLRKAAADLKPGSRSATTSDLFLKIFRVRPQFVPTWLKQTATIKDRGDVVATRCSRVADLLASGRIRFFCTVNSTNCPDCTQPPTDRTHACSSFGSDRVICLGPAFWNAMKAGDTDSLLATLMHEPFHIYYGIYVTQHERRRPDGTLESVGKFGGINCIVQFVFETNGRAAPQRVNDRCANTAVRQELEFPP